MGDTNSKYFQTIATIQRTRNAIHKLKLSSVIVIFDLGLIAKESTLEFSTWLRKDNNCVVNASCVTVEDNNYLISEFTNEELSKRFLC